MIKAVVILAAGQGTRMKSPLAKVLHPLLGRPVIVHVLESLGALTADRTFVVVGHQRRRVEPLLTAFGAQAIVQEPQLGTGHAVMSCLDALTALGDAEVLLASADVPLLPVESLGRFWERFSAGSSKAALVSVTLQDPTGYGRLVRDGAGKLARVVEERDATEAERAVSEVNAGVYFFRSPEVFRWLKGLGRQNAQGEYYLTDLFAALYAAGNPADVFSAGEPERWLGANTQAELAQATARLRRDVVERWMAAGVTVMDPATTWIETSVRMEPGVVLHPGVRLCGTTGLGAGVEVRSYSVLTDTAVGPGTLIKEHCVLEMTRVGADCIIGPFARTREGTVLEERVHLGNFVETKKAVLGKGAKANHLSYLGDASVGGGSNIGAGTITCNYDGKLKHRTVLGEGVFIGSDTQLVAPVSVGDGAYVGAGTTVTRDVPAGALAVSRAPQKNVEGWVERKRKRGEASKAPSGS